MTMSFNITLEGWISPLCRDNDDRDALTTVLCVTAWRRKVLIVVYDITSDSCRAGILASGRPEADKFLKEVKRVYSMWLSCKYGLRNSLDKARCRVDPVEDFSSWRGSVPDFSLPSRYFKVKDLTRRAVMELMHTGAVLRDVPWLLDAEYRLVPCSFCHWEYLGK